MNISQQLQQVKYNDQIERMQKCRKAIDFFRNNSNPYIEQNIDSIYVKGGKLYKKFIRKIPLTQRLIEDQSLLFKQAPVIKYNGTENQKQLFFEVVTESQFNSMLITLNRLVNLVGKVGVLPRYYDGYIVFDLLTPDRVMVQQVENFPTQIKSVMYWVNNYSDTPGKI